MLMTGQRLLCHLLSASYRILTHTIQSLQLSTIVDQRVS
jgi:hypothetical protein